MVLFDQDHDSTKLLLSYIRPANARTGLARSMRTDSRITPLSGAVTRGDIA